MVEAQYLGLMDYAKSMAVMEQLALRVEQDPRQIYLMGLEYSRIVTLGRAAQVESEVLDQNWDVFSSDRGGLATVHNRGQLVIYPIVSLSQLGCGVKNFVSLLTEATKQLLLSYQIESRCLAPAGLTTESGKICSIGLKISKSVSRHGLSLNVFNNLEDFNAIRVCGASKAKLDNMALHLKPEPSLEILFKQWTQNFLVLGQIDRDS